MQTYVKTPRVEKGPQHSDRLLRGGNSMPLENTLVTYLTTSYHTLPYLRHPRQGRFLSTTCLRQVQNHDQKRWSGMWKRVHIASSLEGQFGSDQTLAIYSANLNNTLQLPFWVSYSLLKPRNTSDRSPFHQKYKRNHDSSKQDFENRSNVLHDISHFL